MQLKIKFMLFESLHPVNLSSCDFSFQKVVLNLITYKYRLTKLIDRTTARVVEVMKIIVYRTAIFISSTDFVIELKDRSGDIMEKLNNFPFNSTRNRNKFICVHIGKFTEYIQYFILIDFLK